jgi:hypothetical protein
MGAGSRGAAGVFFFFGTGTAAFLGDKGREGRDGESGRGGESVSESGGFK